MKNLKKLSVLMVAMGISSTPMLAHATNGLFVIGFGNKSQAMGGAGIALQLDSLSAASNPASISGMGTRFDIGADFFVAKVEAQLGSVSSKSDSAINGMGLNQTFLLPSMGGTYQYNDKYTVGVAVVPVGGGGTKYGTNFFEATKPDGVNAPTINEILGVDLVIGEIVTTIAYKMDKYNHFGASLVIGIARFEAYGLGLFDTFTQNQGSNAGFTNQGKEWSLGAGYKIGWLGTYDDLNIGVSYSSEVWMNQFDQYEELFAEGGRLDVPAVAGIGIAYKVVPDVTLAFDVTYTFYEDVKSISNKGPNLAGGPPLDSDAQKLGRSEGLGFGWENQTVYKLGAAYQYDKNIIMRAGWNYGKNPIDESTQVIFNLLAPAVTEHHLTLGGTYLLGSDMELNFSYVHAFAVEISGPTYISDDGSNYGRAKMSQDTLGGSFSMKF